MRERDKLFKRYCNEINSTLKAAKHNKYKNARNVAIFKVKQSKNEYYENYFQKHFKNVKKTWGGIKSVVTLKSKDKATSNLLMVNGNVITNKSCIAEIFDDFFVNVGSSLASRIPKGKRPFKTYLRKSVVNSFFINPVHESEIEKLTNNLNKNKSLGPCSIPVKILQNHIDVLKQPLTYIINLSFQQGISPEALKTARVTPIFKKKDPQLPSNYRAISFLSVFSKLYEKCMYCRLYAFLTKYKLLFKERFGFRNNHSTSHALISLIDMIKKYLDNDYFFCGVFIDIQKAFDTFNHEILLVKLNFYGIRGLDNSWLKSFLENRKQYVNLPGHFSSIEAVTFGVPQGSAWGPLLFLIYVNDLQSVFSKSVVHHFADDTNLLFPAKKLGTIESVVKHELKLLAQWLQSNKLSLNETKTELIIFRSPWKHLPREPDIRINNYKLKLHSRIKYLGILIDEVLSGNKQIVDICTKLARTNGILSKLRHFVPRKTCVSVYFSLFYSYALYGCLVWSYSTQRNIDRIIKLQKRCIRIIIYSEFTEHTGPIFSEIKLLKVKDIFWLTKPLFTFDFINENVPKELKAIFAINRYIHPYETRSSIVFHIPKAKTSRFGLHTLRYYGANLWNKFYHALLYKETNLVKAKLKKLLQMYFLGTSA